MKLTLLYFGHPREALGLSTETVDAPDDLATLAELLAWLRQRGGVWATELTEPRLRCALNQRMTDWSARPAAGDEVALFSPISGG